MNIYKQEFKMILKSVITWSVAVALIIFVVMSMYSAFALDAKVLNEMMEEFPEELLMAFGMNGMDLSTVLGFYSLIFLVCQICLAIQAANYGVSLLSIEERELTADFLLAKPVGRRTILTSKFLAAFTGLTITNATIWLTSFIFIDVYKGGRMYDTKPLLLLLLSIVLFQLFFLTVGMFLSLLVKRVRSVQPFSMALAFGMYFVNAFGGMLGDDKLEMLSPFRHFDPNYILVNASYEIPLVLVSVLLIVIAIVGSYALYARRDIHSAV